MHERKQPLFHLVKRGELSPKYALLIRLASILTALLVGALVFLLLGSNPIKAYGEILAGSLGRESARQRVVNIAVPLLGTALAIAPCFRMKFWNIGAEGQITAGAVGATFFALTFGGQYGIFEGKEPSLLLLLMMALGAMICGAFWALIPAFFHAKWGTNETLFTLMLNYIAIGIVKWLQGGPWEGKPGSQIIPNFHASALLPKVFGVHIGWILVLLLTVLIFVYMRYTKHGYEIAVLGESMNTARYAGMNVAWITIRTMLLSGAIAGLVGFMIVSGANKTLYFGVAGGVGFTAITVAWLAQLNPFAMIVISLMLAVLEKGAGNLETVMGIPTSIADIITGVILLFMLASEFFVRYRLALGSRGLDWVRWDEEKAPAAEKEEAE